MNDSTKKIIKKIGKSAIIGGAIAATLTATSEIFLASVLKLTEK